MEAPQTAVKSVFSKPLIFIYKIIGVLFAAIAALNLLILFPVNLLRSFFVFAALYAVYAGLSGVLAYGFWKTKKWIVPLLGGTFFIMAIADIINVVRGAQKIDQVLAGIAILSVLFLFTYFSRNLLAGEYKNLKVIGFFLAVLIISQAVIIFLN